MESCIGPYRAWSNGTLNNNNIPCYINLVKVAKMENWIFKAFLEVFCLIWVKVRIKYSIHFKSSNGKYIWN